MEKQQQFSSGLSFQMPAGNLFETEETAPPDSVPVTHLFQMPILSSESFGKTPSKTKTFLQSLFG